jgi:hypothetical protein
MGTQGVHTEFWWGSLLENVNFEKEDGDGGVILRRNLRKCVGWVVDGTGAGSRPMEGFDISGFETWGFI